MLPLRKLEPFLKITDYTPMLTLRLVSVRTITPLKPKWQLSLFLNGKLKVIPREGKMWHCHLCYHVCLTGVNTTLYKWMIYKNARCASRPDDTQMDSVRETKGGRKLQRLRLPSLTCIASSVPQLANSDPVKLTWLMQQSYFDMFYIYKSSDSKV